MIEILIGIYGLSMILMWETFELRNLSVNGRRFWNIEMKIFEI